MSKKYDPRSLGIPSEIKIKNPDRTANTKPKDHTVKNLEQKIIDQCNAISGRPTVAELKELKLIEYLCRRGSSLKFIHEQINDLREKNDETTISYPTFLKLRQRFPQFFAPIKKWKEAATDQVESALFRACLGEGRKESNVQAQQFWLTNMRSKEWQKTQVIEMPDMGKMSEQELINIINNEIRKDSEDEDWQD